VAHPQTTSVAAALIFAFAAFGLLITAVSFSGHPPEWLLDSYYRHFSKTGDAEDASGAVAFVAGIGTFSAALAFMAAALYAVGKV